MVIDNITHGWYNSDKLVNSQQLNRYIKYKQMRLRRGKSA